MEDALFARIKSNEEDNGTTILEIEVGYFLFVRKLYSEMGQCLLYS